MIKRIIEVSTPARLSVKHAQLVIEREDSEPATVPIEDIGALILDHPAITHTQGVLTACAKNNVAILVCDERHLPGSVLLPMEGNSLQSKTIALQTSVAEPVRKRLWQAIIQAKIREQAKVLSSTKGNADPLPAYVNKVRSGDPENIEAQAARIYWVRLFGEDFRRDPDASGTNALLNYGYAIIRAAVARALVGAGLHPSIGLHHHNQYDSFALADDLVEPYRPLVDLKVYELRRNSSSAPKVDKESKKSLLDCLAWECQLGERRLPMMVALHYYTASLRRVLAGSDKTLEIPSL